MGLCRSPHMKPPGDRPSWGILGAFRGQPPPRLNAWRADIRLLFTKIDIAARPEI